MGTITELKQAVRINEVLENTCERCACRNSDHCRKCEVTTVRHYTISNAKCFVEYSPEAKSAMNFFDGEDLTDQNNLPAFYSETMRTHKKAWKALTEQFTADTTMHGAIRILWDNGIKCHSWCRMN